MGYSYTHVKKLLKLKIKPKIQKYNYLQIQIIKCVNNFALNLISILNKVHCN